MSTPERTVLSELSPESIAETLNLKKFQGEQIFRWIHQRRVFDFAEMTDLSKDTRQRLIDTCAPLTSTVVREATSPVSGTIKKALKMADGEIVETVLLQSRERVTLCLSTQAGCPLGCLFCATGISGFRRNLTATEILEQALWMLKGIDLGERTPNVVFMGMGEPFLNYDEVMRSIEMLQYPKGLGIGARKITVSTAGHVPGIRRFAREDSQVRLSVSLHGANNDIRSRMMPINRTYSLQALIQSLTEYQRRSGRQISFEWTLIRGINDAPADAHELAELVRPLDCVINVIPFNPVEGCGYEAAPVRHARAFRDRLEGLGLKATLREERGRDIDAACGQLRRRLTDK